MGKIHKHGINYHIKALHNLYSVILQRKIDSAGIESYKNSDYVNVIRDLENSAEYFNLINSKTEITTLPKKINYTIIKVNNRADETIKDLHKTLGDQFIYHDMEFVNYKNTDVNQFFSDRNIQINWLADLFGLKPTTSPSELAVAASHIVALEYLLANNLDELIVFEDDSVLNPDFIRVFSNSFNDLPQDYDIMSDTTIFPDYQEISTEDKDIRLDSKYICRAYLQNSCTAFMLYSKKGANKILEYYRKIGLICAIDTYLYWLNRRNDLQIYTTYHSNRLLLDTSIHGTLITNERTQNEES